MCFSPEASYITSAGLSVIGVASVRSALKEEKVLAVIPFLFAVQQAAEGFQWLAIKDETVNMAVAYVFLFFALIVWPICIPAVVYFLDKKTRSRIRWFLVAGIGTSMSLLVVLLSNRLEVSEIGRSIAYQFGSQWGIIYILLYLFSTAGSLLCSSIRPFRWFALLGVVSFIISQLFYSFTFISVWCFFAAVLSSFIFLYIRRPHKDNY